MTGSLPKEHDSAEFPKGTIILVKPLPKVLANSLRYYYIENNRGNYTISYNLQIANTDNTRCTLELVVSYFKLYHSSLYAEDN